MLMRFQTINSLEKEEEDLNKMLIQKGKKPSCKKQYKGYLTGKNLEQIIISLHSWTINHDKKSLIA